MKDVNYTEQQMVALYFNLATQKAERRVRMLSNSEKDENNNSTFRERSIPWQMEQHQDSMAYSIS